MLKHEVKLIDPGADQIVAALTETTAGANKRCRARLLADDPAKWRKFARKAAAAAEGHALFRGGRGGVPATQVLAAWWTDAAGRKHVVLRGRRVEHDEAKRLLQSADLDARPALWHAYPEYVCRRTVGAESQVVCACGCGAVGTPESLGWMGETCGPCFDRKQEVGPAGLSTNLPGVLYGNRDPLGTVACSPDGSRVAAKEGDDCVTYWDIPTRTRTVTRFPGAHVADVAITSDARHLIAVGFGALDLRVGLFAAFDLTTDPPARIERALGTDRPAFRVVALRAAGAAVVQSVQNDNATPTRADVVRVPSGDPVHGFNLSGDDVGRLAVSPDGTRLATCGRRVAVFDLRTGALQREFWLAACSDVGFSADGTRVIGSYSGKLQSHDLATGKPIADGRVDRSRGVPLADGARSLVVDPAGRFVYVGSWQGKLYAFAADSLELCAVFEWHLGAVQGLALSADGSRLFSSGGDGCVKVWPIRDLLRGVNEPHAAT
ncbi:WD40 repeat domain-containing protein [Frigoriglobus tundricola]|uniref:WD40 repeat domain-containing protein n=1 Tax=Frigoriglobus tundricola TaxID=2774151 RepID=A0A6M5YKU9_9BACT|nr:hypothetical protein [Frigoriglobus tundricola]QJW94204.1 hypothetical protein FTUN_1724 [Frigoriglobus tundricola]